MSIQSARNNLTKAKNAGILNAAQACAYLKALHKLTGKSEQFILSEMVVMGVEHIPEYVPYKDIVKEGIEKENE